MSNQDRGEWTSASDALADRLCRGRHQAQRDLPQLPATEESEAGGVIHALWTGEDPPRQPTADEIDKAEALRQQEAAIARDFFGSNAEVVRIVERRLWHEFGAQPRKARSETLRTSGQFDVALVHPKSRRALICDGKSGWLPVTPSPSNLQLRRLAALLWLQIRSQEIGVCILTPFGLTEHACVYETADLQRSVAELEADVRLSHEPEAPRTAGEDQCRYCRAREICPTRLEWIAAALPEALSPLPMVSARKWSPNQRALFLEREKAARDWLETRREEIKALLAESPMAVPGYALKPGRVLETINDSQTVWKRFATLGGSMESFLTCISVGKAAFREQVRALTGQKGKLLDTQVESLLTGCTESKSSAPVIEKLQRATRSRLAESTPCSHSEPVNCQMITII